jgi:hypothetical protein
MIQESSQIIGLKTNHEESDVPRQGRQSVPSCRKSGVNETRPVRHDVNTLT